MQTRPVVLAFLAAAGLAACVPSLPALIGLPDLTEAPPLSATQFPDEAPLPAGATPRPASATPRPASSSTTTPAASPVPGATPAGPALSENDPFARLGFDPITTKTKFKPVFSFTIDASQVNAQPSVTIDAYQTANELEIKEIRALVERTTFRYDQLKVGTQVGGGQMDIGTPPKASATVSIVCTETDSRTYGVFAIKARHPAVTIYLSDIKIKDNDGNLQLTSISNFSRGNDHTGRRTTEKSARVVQKFDPGWFLLSATPGALRSLVLIYSEGDPAQQDAQALQVIRQSLWLN